MPELGISRNTGAALSGPARGRRGVHYGPRGRPLSPALCRGAPRQWTLVHRTASTARAQTLLANRRVRLTASERRHLIGLLLLITVGAHGCSRKAVPVTQPTALRSAAPPRVVAPAERRTPPSGEQVSIEAARPAEPTSSGPASLLGPSVAALPTGTGYVVVETHRPDTIVGGQDFRSSASGEAAGETSPEKKAPSVLLALLVVAGTATAGLAWLFARRRT
jgi:hypothetical protein